MFSDFSYSEAKLLITLIGNRDGFYVSQGFFNNCGISESSYKSARKTLSEAGIIEYIPYRSIGVNYPVLYKKLGVDMSPEHKPTIDEITDYITVNGLKLDANRFFNYYEQSDWTTKNGTAVHDWKRKVDEWAKRQETKSKKSDDKQKRSQSTDNTIEDKSPSYNRASNTVKYWDEEKACWLKRRATEAEIRNL